MNNSQKNPIAIFIINVIAIIVAYYASLLLHEWGHGTLAWLNGVKNSPLDIQYGGCFLMNADENVDYSSLIDSGHGVVAALIGIAGVSVSILFVIVCFILLDCKSIQCKPLKYTFCYWFLIINMIPVIQYLSISTFSLEGDVGRFIHGLNISGWWIFIPGTIFNIYAIWRILKIELPKSYAVISIKSTIGRNIFLLATLSIIFLFIYTHGYNPFTDQGMDMFSRALAIISIALVPILFILSNPARNWVKKSIVIYNNKLRN